MRTFYSDEDEPQNGKAITAEMQSRMTSDEFMRRFELGFPPVNQPPIEDAVTRILTAVGEDPQRDGLVNTPARVARMYEELLGGYRVDPVKLINGALFEVDYKDMVVVKDIEFSSLCEHHMLPFMGHAHVAYIPDGKVVGLSKIPRVVDMFAHRLQVQERMTHQIAHFINEVLHPCGVAVVIEGMHLCSMIRGVKKGDASMTTSAMVGVFAENSITRAEFMGHLGRPGTHI